MRSIRVLTIVTCSAALAACGTDQTFADAAPTYNTLAMNMTSADTNAPTNTAAQGLTADPACHPHLFLRTREVVRRVNLHLYLLLKRVAAVLLHRATHSSANERVWEHTRADGTDVRLTIDKTAAKTFTFKLEAEAAGGSAFVTIMSGNIDRSNATAPHEGVGSLSLDLTALHNVAPADRLSGTVTVKFDSNSTSRKIVVDAQQVAWEVASTQPDGTVLSATALAALEAPRNAHYVFYRKPGSGGSLKIEDEMIFLCPGNPNFKLATVDLVTRWYRLADGSVHGRSDGLITGGQLPDHTITQIDAVTCHQAANEAQMQVEGYWLMKAEDGSGATIASATFDSSNASPPVAASTCDTAFGPMPSVTDNSTDFDFNSIDFTGDTPADFPQP